MRADFIPVADPKAQALALKAELAKAISSVLDSGYYILGSEVRDFEKEFASYLGVSHCIGVANGTDAISLALRAVGVQPGCEVITSAHTAVATVAAIEHAGAVPVLGEIDSDCRCLSPAEVEPLITAKTAAIVQVHIYGHPADMEGTSRLASKYGLKVIEDCAQAHGAEINGKKVGTFGDAAAFSFYPTKNLGALGDGGAVVTNSPQIAEAVEELRQYGWKDRYVSNRKGFNSRLDEMQASILRVKLKHLDSWNERRRRVASAFQIAMTGSNRIDYPKVPEGILHAMHLYVVEVDQRQHFRDFLQNRNIGTALHYPSPIYAQPAYLGRLRLSPSLKNTEALYRRMVSLPMYPELSDSQMSRICEALMNWNSQNS